MQQLFVSDLMRECSSVLVAENTPLRRAAEILVTQDNPVLITHDESGAISGIVAEAAVTRTLMSNTSRTVTIRSIISRHVESVRANAPLTTILHLFRSACHSAIPVVDDQKNVTGMIYRSDIVRMLLDNGESDSDTRTSSDKSTELTQPHYLKRRRPSAGADQQSRRDDDMAAG